jgi:hypothetical protein
LAERSACGVCFCLYDNGGDASGLEVAMEWWIIGVLAIATIILISIYRVSLRENRALTNYALLLMLDDETYL